jgi:hypothetical protein
MNHLGNLIADLMRDAFASGIIPQPGDRYTHPQLGDMVLKEQMDETTAQWKAEQDGVVYYVNLREMKRL